VAQRQPGGLEGVRDDAARVGALAGQHGRQRCQVGERDLAAVGEGMLLADGEAQRVVPDRPAQERRHALRRQGDHRQFETSLQQLLVGGLRVQELQVQTDVRMGAAEGPQHRRQPVQTDVVARRQREGARHGPGEIADQGARVVDVGEDPSRPGQERAAGLREVRAPADTVEQARVEALLEAADAAADRGLGQVQQVRGAREGAALGDGDEGLEFRGVHGGGLRRDAGFASKP
jgi:hypothetical protein